MKPCFFADPDPYKPTLVDKIFNHKHLLHQLCQPTQHHSQQSTSEQSSKLRVRLPNLLLNMLLVLSCVSSIKTIPVTFTLFTDGKEPSKDNQAYELEKLSFSPGNF
ncbi:hypothetical protein TNCT_124981 [Trichonephila clavata]|uniref:Uncharacterized protein n=1 Tax=Trichonephila clavata TaxID=2740835 RepID=A0A8X6G117_TRICU|nr:hypothetical protein TNCT_124981 [Trichonephila clavata]